MSVDPCPNCGSTEKTPDGQCANCGGVQLTGAVMMQIYVVTGAIFMSILIYAGLAAVLTGSASAKPLAAAAQWVPAAVVGVGALMMIASTLAAFAVPRRDGPRTIVRGVIVTSALAEGPAICGLVATLLTMKLVWMAWGIGFALAAFLVLAFQMPAIATRVQDWERRQRGGR